MAQMSFDEVKKNLWQIVDNKKTKARDKIKALKQLANIAVESLELILILEIVVRVERLSEDLKQREKLILENEKILKEKQVKDEQNHLIDDESKSPPINKLLYFHDLYDE
jgi:hypothetical protein